MGKKLEKTLKEKEKLTEELRLLELRNSELFQQCNRDKENIKKGIIGEVNELVAITKRQDKSLKEFKSKLSLKEEELSRETE